MLGMAALLLFSACTGILDDIYDEPAPNKPPTVEEEKDSVVSGTLYIDATDWTQWFYIDLPGLQNPDTRQQALEQIQQPYAIPTTLTGEGDGRTGIYTYWFDVWGQGISVNEFRYFTPTDAQAAPATWSLAVHRNNVRTNGGGAYETPLTDISLLNMSHEELSKLTFVQDEWTETTVWADQSQMLNSLVGSQGIAINKVLSSWLRLDIPPMPPAFTHNNHVFVMRLSDGTYAALQLANYMNDKGTKCFLSINYKYPL